MSVSVMLQQNNTNLCLYADFYHIIQHGMKHSNGPTTNTRASHIVFHCSNSQHPKAVTFWRLWHLPQKLFLSFLIVDMNNFCYFLQHKQHPLTIKGKVLLLVWYLIQFKFDQQFQRNLCMIMKQLGLEMVQCETKSRRPFSTEWSLIKYIHVHTIYDNQHLWGWGTPTGKDTV